MAETQTERNKAILTMHRNKVTTKKIAQVCGISTSRVKQIIEWEKTKEVHAKTKAEKKPLPRWAGGM